MSTACPNKNSAEWIKLVDSLGEREAYKIFIANNDQLPNMEVVDALIKAHNNNPLKFSKVHSTRWHDDFYSTGFDPVEEDHIINVLNSSLMSVLKEYNNINASDIINGDVKDIKEALIDDFKKRTKNITDQDIINFNDRVVSELNYKNSILWLRLKNYALRNLGIEISDIDKIQEEYLEKSWEENAAFSISSSDNVKRDIKIFISSIEKDTISSFTGLNENVEFSDIYYKLQTEMANKHTPEQMLNHLSYLGYKYDPIYLKMYNELSNNELLLSAWFTAFDKQMPERYVELYRKFMEKTDISIRVANRNAFSQFVITDNWLTNLDILSKFGYHNDKFVAQYNNEYNELIDELKDINKPFNRDGIAKKINSLYTMFGFNIPIESVLANMSNLNLLNEYKDYAKKDATDIEKENYKIKQLLGDYYINLLEKIKDFAIQKNQFYTDKTIEPVFNQMGATNRLADITKAFLPNLIEPNSTTVNDTNVFTVQNPNFVSSFFKMFKDKEALLEWGKIIQNEPAIQYDNWFWNENKIGVFNYNIINGRKVINESNPINNEFLSNFNFALYEGGKNTLTNRGQEYGDKSPNDWALTRLVYYINNNEQGGKSNYAMTFGIIPSDHGHDVLIRHNKIRLDDYDYINLFDNVNEFKNTLIFKKVFNTVLQERERILQATKFVFNTDENGKVIRSANGDPIINENNKDYFILNYHYKMDKKGNPIYIDKDGNPVGNTFKFHNMYVNNESLNDTDIFLNGFLPGNTLTKADKELLEDFTIKFLQYEIKEDAKRLNKFEQILSKVYPKYHNNFTTLLAEFTINQFIANVAMQNMFGMVTAFYKDYNDTNKRAKQTLSNGNSYNPNQTLITVTAADVFRNTKYFDNINIADGLSLLTLKGYKKHLIQEGDYDKYKPLIDRLEKGKRLTPKQKTKLLAPLKNFYYGYDYSSNHNMRIPVQIKNSAQLIHPLLHENTGLSELADFLDQNNIDQLNFASAEKTGSLKIANIANSDGSLNLNEETKKELLATKREHSFRNLRKQQEVVNHGKDHNNTLGKQIARIILNNIVSSYNYELPDGTFIKGSNIKQYYFDILSARIEEQSDNLLIELGATFDENNQVVTNETGDIIIDRNKLSKLILDNISILDDNIVYTLSNNLSLSDTSLQNKFIAIATSLFTNRIIKLKHPGDHLAQMANVFTEKSEYKRVAQSDIKNYIFRKLKYTEHKAAGYEEAEVILPAWTKKFFTDKGEIIDINEIPEEIRTIIGYRIPTEAKYSKIVFKVVGFMPEELGSIIMLPDEFIAQSGSDFDIDSVYTMVYNFKVRTNPDGERKFTKIKYYDVVDETTEENKQIYNNLLNNYIFSLVRYSETAKNDVTKIIEIKNESLKRFKRLITNRKITLSTYRNLQNKDKDNKIQIINDYNDIIEHKEFMLSVYNQLIDNIETYENNLNDIINEGEEEKAQNGFISSDDKYINDIKELRKIANEINELNKEIDYTEKEFLKLLEEYGETELNKRKKVSAINTQISVEMRLYNDQINEIINKYRPQFDKLSVQRKNSDKARQNKILDIYYALLTTKKAFSEVKATSNFEDITNAKTKLDELINDVGIAQYDTIYKGIVFEKDSTPGYKERTIKNASADVTIAIAFGLNLDMLKKSSSDLYKLRQERPNDLNIPSAGEKLTYDSVIQQNKKYIPVNAGNINITDDRVKKIVDSLNTLHKSDLFNEKTNITLNIAGNGIYTMKGKYTQQQVDDFTYNLLKAVIEHPDLKVNIISIRTGGQTGFDEAGAKAGVKLNIPTKIYAPGNWSFRNINGEDIKNEQQFKNRFVGYFGEEKIKKDIIKGKQIINPATVRGQDEYRTAVIGGRTLKGFSVNRDAFISLSQISNIHITPEYGIKVKYNLDDLVYKVPYLKTLYGANNVVDNGDNTVTITHTRIGWSGQYNQNAWGKLITAYSAQTTANILDNVKYPLHKNINTYTFEIWRTFAEVGSNYNVATSFIAQPAITRLIEVYFDNVGLTGSSNIDAIKDVRRFYMGALFSQKYVEVNATNKKIPNKKAISAININNYINEMGKDAFDNFSKRNKKEFKSNEEAIDFLRLKINKEVRRNIAKLNKKLPTYFSFDVAKVLFPQNNNFVLNEDELNNMITMSLDINKYAKDKEKLIEYYQYQIDIINEFEKQKQLANSINIAIRATNIDKTEVGTDLNHFDYINNSISGFTTDTILLIEDELAGIKINDSYNILNSFYTNAHYRGYKTLSQFFISETTASLFFKNELSNYVKKSALNERTLKKINNFISTIAISNNEYFSSINEDEKLRILGQKSDDLTNLNLKEVTEENKAIFDRLSLADKIILVKTQLTDYISPNNTTHILNYLIIDNSEETVATKGRTDIRLMNNEKTNYMIKTFKDMYYNDGIYAHYINSIANDLIKYSFFVDGLNFTFTGLSKVIPAVVKNDSNIGIYDTIERALNEFNNFDNAHILQNYIVTFLLNNTNNPNLVPTVEQKYTDVFDEETESFIHKKDPESVDWTPNNDGIIITNEERLYQENFQIRNSLVVNIPFDYSKVLLMGLEGTFDKVIRGEKTQTTRPFTDKSKSIKVGDIVNIWDGNKEKPRYVQVRVTDVREDSGKAIFDYINNLPFNDEHFKREGRENQLEHIGNLKKIKLHTAKKARIINFELLPDAKVTNYKIKNIENRPFVKVSLSGAKNIYYIPAPKLEGYEIGYTSYNPINNPEYTQLDYVTIINQIESNLKFSKQANSRKKASYEDSLIKLLQDFKISKLKDLSAFRHANSKNFNKFIREHNKKVDEAIDFELYTLYDLREALVHTVRYNHAILYGINDANFKTQGLFAEIEYWKNFDFENDTDKENTRKKLTSFLYNARNFISTFSYITEVQTHYDRSQYPQDEITKKDLDSIDRAVKILQEQYNEVRGLELSIRNLHLDQIERDIKPLTSNPDIINGAVDFFDAGFDENWYQMMLDSLYDTHNPMIANFVKFVRIEMQKAKKLKFDKRVQFEEERKLFLDSGGNDDLLFELNTDNNRTGRLVQKYNQNYYDELTNEYEKLNKAKNEFGEDSIEFYTALKEFNKWKIDNTEQEYLDEYYKDKLIISPAAMLVRDKLAKREKAILDKYRGISGYKANKITDSDKALLDDIAKERRAELKGEGTLSKEDADTWNEYNKAMAKYFVPTGDSNFVREFNEAKSKGREALHRFLVRNAKPSASFWNSYKAYRKAINDLVIEVYGNNPKDTTIIDILEKYKDRDDLINIDEMQPGDYYIIMNSYKSKENRSGLSADEYKANKTKINKIKRLRKQLDNFIEKIPTDYYYDKRNEVIANLKVDEKLEDTDWFKENHVTNEDGKAIPLPMWTTIMPATINIVEVENNGQSYVIYTGIIPNKNWNTKLNIDSKFNNPNFELDYKNRPVPKQKHINNNWKTIQSSPTTKRFYDYLTGLLGELMSHYNDSIIHQGYLPAVAIDNRKGASGFIQREIEKAGWYDLNRDYDSLIFNKMGDEVKQIPLPFVRFVNKLDIYDIPKREANELLNVYKERALKEVNEANGTNFKSFEDLMKYNEKANKFNSKLVGDKHGSNISYDLDSIIPAFINTTLNHKAKKAIEKEILLFGTEVEQTEFKRVNSLGKTVVDAIENKVRKSKPAAETKLPNSNISKHFKDWLNRYFYEEWEIDEGTATKLGRVLQNYVSKKGIGLNPFSAMNNLVYGRMQMIIESAAGYYCDINDIAIGKKLWNGNVTHFIADTFNGSEKSNSLVAAILKQYDILMDSTEMANKPDGRMHSEIRKKLMKVNAWYFMQSAGEHYMQNVILLAMMNSHRIINGKLMTEADYIEQYESIDYRLDLNQLRESTRMRKQEIKIKKEEFKKFPKLIDAYELVNGVAVLKSNFEINENEIELFKERVLGVNQKLHGIYNREDKGMINRLVLGRLAMQFRHWIRPGWVKRFGTKFGKVSWNERRGEYDKGMYVSTWEFFTIPFKKNNKINWDSEEERTAFNAISAILRDYGKFIANVKLYYHILSPIDKANVKRSMIEFVYLLGTIALFNMLLGLKDDDDEEEGLLYNALIYQLDRTKTELLTYSPLYGWFNESQKILRSPTATWKTYEDTYKLAHAVFMYPYREIYNPEANYYQNGIYRGKNRVQVLSYRLIPGLTQWQRIQYLEKMNRYYKLF